MIYSSYLVQPLLHCNWNYLSSTPAFHKILFHSRLLPPWTILQLTVQHAGSSLAEPVDYCVTFSFGFRLVWGKQDVPCFHLFYNFLEMLRARQFMPKTLSFLGFSKKIHCWCHKIISNNLATILNSNLIFYNCSFRFQTMCMCDMNYVNYIIQPNM